MLSIQLLFLPLDAYLYDNIVQNKWFIPQSAIPCIHYLCLFQGKECLHDTIFLQILSVIFVSLMLFFLVMKVPERFAHGKFEYFGQNLKLCHLILIILGDCQHLFSTKICFNSLRPVNQRLLFSSTYVYQCYTIYIHYLSGMYYHFISELCGFKRHLTLENKKHLGFI